MIFKRPPFSLLVCAILSGIFAAAQAADWPLRFFVRDSPFVSMRK